MKFATSHLFSPLLSSSPLFLNPIPYSLPLSSSLLASSLSEKFLPYLQNTYKTPLILPVLTQSTVILFWILLTLLLESWYYVTHSDHKLPISLSLSNCQDLEVQVCTSVICYNNRSNDDLEFLTLLLLHFSWGEREIFWTDALLRGRQKSPCYDLHLVNQVYSCRLLHFTYLAKVHVSCSLDPLAFLLNYYLCI